MKQGKEDKGRTQAPRDKYNMMGKINLPKGTKVKEAGEKQDVFNVVHKPINQTKMFSV